MYLNCHSYHSLRYGTIVPQHLVELAKKNNLKALGLTDINTATGVYDFIKLCKDNQIKPIIGIEYRNDNKLLYVGLANTFEGHGELCKFLTDHKLAKTNLPEQAPPFKNASVIYPIDNVPKELRNNEFIGIKPRQLIKLMRKEWQSRIGRMVILQPVTVVDEKGFYLHKILRCIDRNIIFTKLDEQDCCENTEQMQPVNKLVDLYQDYPSIIENTEKLIESCNVEFDFKTPKNKRCYLESKQADDALLKKIAYEGLEKRYGKGHKAAAIRVEQELKVIDKLSFAAYFLITWDIVQQSKKLGFRHVGRGSGANSIVSYCIGITDICPLELNLYFERFLNPSRTSPPDFDIDWSWKNRDTILEYIYQRFGPAHVAFTGTIVQFKYRSIIREFGKVFGLAKRELDALTRRSANLDNLDADTKRVYDYAIMLVGFPNQRSMHSCGVLISEQPITDYINVQILPKGFPTTEMDMNIAEDIGLDKLDILSQRGLGHIDDAIEIIKNNRYVKVDIDDVEKLKQDPACNAYLKVGNTIGSFYIESPAMRGLLRKMKCCSYIHLVAASSIIRPGVSESGMMQEYVRRHNNPHSFAYFHQVFEEQLAETYGIMVYQEDVMKIGHYYAGLDLDKADILRRAMNNRKISAEEFESLRQNFYDNCAKKNHPLQLTNEVFRQIQSFAGFSFCKAHSASYAVESYQSLYLKVNFPIEFMVAVINNFGGFYRTEVYVHEAKMAGAKICNPCVNTSDHLTKVIGTEVYLGFIHIQGLKAAFAEKIVSEREHNGPYKSLEDFLYRTNASKVDLFILASVGALRFTKKTRGQLVMLGSLIIDKKEKESNGPSLFTEPLKDYVLPPLLGDKFDAAFSELQFLGFITSFSPFDLLVTKYRGDVMAKALVENDTKNIRMLGYLISTKENPTKNGMMNFGTWIDAEGGKFDTVHFPKCLQNYPFNDGGIYLLRGRVQVDNDFPVLIIEKMQKMPFIKDTRHVDEKLQEKILQQVKHDQSITHRKPYPTLDETDLPSKPMMLEGTESATDALIMSYH